MTGLDDVRFWLDLIQWLLTAGVALYLWMARSSSATRKEIAELRDMLSGTLTDIRQSIHDGDRESDGRLDDHASRITRLEEQVRHLPTAEKIDELNGRVGQVHADLQRLFGEFDGFKAMRTSMERQIQLMDEYLKRTAGARDTLR